MRSVYRLKWRGRRLWYSYMGAWGPVFTERLRDAELYPNPAEARRSPCWSWPTADVELRRYVRWPTAADKRRAQQRAVRHWRRTGRKL